jgi:methionyl-tRNA formyltransferase
MPPPVAVAAAELGLPLLQPERAADAAPEVERAGIRAMAICAYGQLLRPPFLDALPWLNLHPSLLPRWRGAAPVERALMAGDRQTGVAVMRLVEALDAGPIAALERFDVGPDEDAGAVMERALDLGVPLLARALDAAAAGTLELQPQPDQGVTYAAKLARGDRLLDPAAPAAEAHDRVRALSPHIGALLRLGGQDVVVWQTARSDATLAPGEVDAEGGTLTCGFAAGALELLDLQLPGRRRMDAASLLRGWRGALGPAERIPG